MSRFRTRRPLFAALLLAAATPVSAQQAPSDATTLINWLLEEERDLAGIPFGEVLAATSGKKIITIDHATDSPWLEHLSSALDRTLAAINTPTHPIHDVARINEASRHIEDQLLMELNSVPGWTCSIPETSDGKEQRSGYPDLRLELEDGRVVYLDPKLYARDSRDSSLRTFYYEPKTTTAKVHDDAVHLLVGVAHNSGEGGTIRFEKWELVDISRIRVRLKAEFQASNRDLYNTGSIIRSASATSSAGD